MAQVSGLYLHLFHGRESIEEDLEDWGADGPTIGPIKYCHTTYTTEVKFAFSSKEAYEKFKGTPHMHFHIHEPSNYYAAHLNIAGDCLQCGDMYYGDWSVFYQKEVE